MILNQKFLLLLILGTLSGWVCAQSDFDIVKERVVSEILDTRVNDESVEQILKTLNKDGSWPGINYEDVSNTGFEHRKHLGHMVSLSVAYHTESSQYFESKEVSKVINKSLEFWCENDFFCENWWHNQIGTPNSLVAVLLVMDNHIDPELKERTLVIIGRAHLDASGARQGGDRIKVGGIAAKKGLAVGDEDKFGEIMKVINEEIRFTTGDRGLQHDNSFHHRVDRVNTTYSYGGGYASVFAEWSAYVSGTRFAFTKERIEQLIDYYLDGICKQAVYGIYLDKGTMNRGISRRERFRPMGTGTPERLMMASDYRKDELQEIVSLRRGDMKPSTSFASFYWQSEHFVCQRPGFYTSVRMYSVRNRNMEWPYNSEGLLNHHRGDGTNYLSIKGNEYLNIWPVYDWQKIPGTTVLQKPSLPSPDEIQKDGVTEFVGAVTDGIYGAATFDFISPHDFIRARKAWFFFDDEYVCLGAGIESASSGYPVVTTLNQALLKGDVVIADGENTFTSQEGELEIDQTKWVHHNGTGYIFPEPTTIQISNKEESGRWTELSKQSTTSDALVKMDVFKLWIDHGPRPQGRPGGLNNAPMIAKDVKYQYIVVPSVGLDQMDEDRGIEILANTRTLQAVKDRESGMVQIIFYQAGEVAISEEMKISNDSQGAVMLKMEEDTIKEISVADPSRKLSRMHMTIAGNQETKEFAIDLPIGFYTGQSVTIKY